MMTATISELDVLEYSRDIHQKFPSMGPVRYTQYEPSCVGFEGTIAKNLGYRTDDTELVRQAVERLVDMGRLELTEVSRQPFEGGSHGSHGQRRPDFVVTIELRLT
jgi:hypothetical protein